MIEENAPLPCAHCGKVFAWGEDADSEIVGRQGDEWANCRGNAAWKLTFHMHEAHPDQLHRCERRGEHLGMNTPFKLDRMEKGDYWHVRDHHRVCSYCGSMHPDEFFAAIERGNTIVPTDKNYKAYVDLPNPDAGTPCVVGGHSGPVEACEQQTGRSPTLAEINLGTFSEPIYGQQADMIHAKFYFPHLDQDGQQKLVDLYNGDQIKFGDPGHFYRLPFFMKREDYS